MKTKLSPFLAILCLALIFSACQKELSFGDTSSPGSSAGTAKFTYAGGTGTCTSPAVSGIYQAGSGLDITNNVIVQVNVTDTGSYSITSTSLNGIKFYAAGLFIITGPQSVQFVASGTPAAGGSFNYILGTGGCTFNIICSGSTIPPVNNSNCKACVYIPLCAGSKFAYYDTTSGTASIRNADLLTKMDTTIDGKIFQKIMSSTGAGYYNCTNGETTAIGYQLVSASGNTLQKIKMIMLKANASVGTTWSDTINNSSGQAVIQKLTIASKGTSRMVGTFNFPDVIAVNLETGIDLPGIGYLAFTTSTYYYAKGVGLVEMNSGDAVTGTSFYHSVIKSYYIP